MSQHQVSGQLEVGFALPLLRDRPGSMRSYEERKLAETLVIT